VVAGRVHVLFVAHKTAVLLRWLAHYICQLRHANATIRMLPVDECDAETDKVDAAVVGSSRDV
jgi:hypothetical protein